jgi:hypothetical protein
MGGDNVLRGLSPAIITRTGVYLGRAPARALRGVRPSFFGLGPEVTMPASSVWPVRLPAACVVKLEELSALAHKPRAQVLRALGGPASLPAPAQ